MRVGTWIRKYVIAFLSYFCYGVSLLYCMHIIEHNLNNLTHQIFFPLADVEFIMYSCQPVQASEQDRDVPTGGWELSAIPAYRAIMTPGFKACALPIF